MTTDTQAYDRHDRVPRERRQAFSAECRRRFKQGHRAFSTDNAAAALLLGTLYDIEGSGMDAIEWLANNDRIAAAGA